MMFSCATVALLFRAQLSYSPVLWNRSQVPAETPHVSSHESCSLYLLGIHHLQGQFLLEDSPASWLYWTCSSDSMTSRVCLKSTVLHHDAEHNQAAACVLLAAGNAQMIVTVKLRTHSHEIAREASVFGEAACGATQRQLLWKIYVSSGAHAVIFLLVMGKEVRS